MDSSKNEQNDYNCDDMVNVSVVEADLEAMQESADDSEDEILDVISDPEEDIITDESSKDELPASDKGADEEQIEDELVEANTKPSEFSEDMLKAIDKYNESIEDIQRTLRRLEKKFSDEILNGENRDSSVKTMYKELNEYKTGIVEKALKNVLYDMVDIREVMLSQIRSLKEKKEVDVISLDEFESYANDIGDILEKHDVCIYKGEAGTENIAVRQKIVRKVETEDDEMVKKIAESLSYGYEYNSKILYPEKVSVYVKKK